MTEGLPRHATSAYGADENGLICGYRFAADADAVPLASGQAAAWLEHGGDRADGFVWLHFNLAHAGAESWLRRHAALAADHLDAIRQGSRSTRIERDGDTLFALMNDTTYDFAFDAGDVATLWVSVGQAVVVTCRLHPLRAVDRLRDAVKRGERLASPAALLDHLFRDQADELQHIARVAADRVDHIEDSLLAHPEAEHGRELGRLRRLAVRLSRLLAPEPGALLRVLAAPPPWMSAGDVQRLRGSSEEFAVALRDIATLQDRIKLLQEESAARVAQENNRSLFMLTMVTVLALPINLTAGLLGMNVGGVPLAGHPHGFWWVVALIAAVTVGVAGYAFGRMRPRR